MRAEDRGQILITIVYYAAVGILFYFCLRYIVPWTLPFLLGVSIAALIRPATLTFAKKMHVSERIAAGFMLLLFYLAALGLILLFLTIVLAQLYELLLQLPVIYAQSISPPIERATQWFYTLAERFSPQSGEWLGLFSQSVSDTVRKTAVDGSAYLVKGAAMLIAKLPMLLITSIFTIVISVLTSLNYHEVGRFIRGMIPEKFLPRFSGLQRFLRETIWQYVRAYTIIMAVTFVELIIGLLLLGFDYVPPVAAVITLLDLLPIIGSGTILIPWGLVLIANGNSASGIGLLILYAIITVVRNIIEPRVVGKQIGLHPIATITAMYAGLKIAGVPGLFVAPVAVLLIRYFKNEGQS
ncbi:sporulation integral membrane protein YtvI [Oscillospiraceae bacterium PP1C4]